MTAHVEAPPRLKVQKLPPNIFSMVMATGIVSIGLNGAGYLLMAHSLFWLNVSLYGILWVLLVFRCLHFRENLGADLKNLARAPGFFTLVAASGVLGNQCVLLFGANVAGLILWIVGLAFWLGLSYVMLPGLMHATTKPKFEEGIHGGWLLVVVGTQAISILACLLAPGLAESARDPVLFISLVFWLMGSMLYIWLITLIFHRVMFLPLTAGELTPPYWISMGAMAISTLAGARLISEAGSMPLLTELLPFLKGMTLLFWATGTWWIPILLALGIWRHIYSHVSLRYEHGFWAAVFPLGMYTVCSQNLVRVFQLPFLSFIPQIFLWIALVAWGLTFVGLLRHVKEHA